MANELENIKELEKKQKEAREDVNIALYTSIGITVFAVIAGIVAQNIVHAIFFAVIAILVFIFWFIPKRTDSRKFADQIKKKKTV